MLPGQIPPLLFPSRAPINLNQYHDINFTTVKPKNKYAINKIENQLQAPIFQAGPLMNGANVPLPFMPRAEKLPQLWSVGHKIAYQGLVQSINDDRNAMLSAENMLARGNLEAAAQILGRPLTDAEISSKNLLAPVIDPVTHQPERSVMGQSNRLMEDSDQRAAEYTANSMQQLVSQAQQQAEQEEAAAAQSQQNASLGLGNSVPSSAIASESGSTPMSDVPMAPSMDDIPMAPDMFSSGSSTPAPPPLELPFSTPSSIPRPSAVQAPSLMDELNARLARHGGERRPIFDPLANRPARPVGDSLNPLNNELLQKIAGKRRTNLAEVERKIEEATQKRAADKPEEKTLHDKFLEELKAYKPSRETKATLEEANRLFAQAKAKGNSSDQLIAKNDNPDFPMAGMNIPMAPTVGPPTAPPMDNPDFPMAGMNIPQAPPHAFQSGRTARLHDKVDSISTIARIRAAQKGIDLDAPPRSTAAKIRAAMRGEELADVDDLKEDNPFDFDSTVGEDSSQTQPTSQQESVFPMAGMPPPISSETTASPFSPMEPSAPVAAPPSIADAPPEPMSVEKVVDASVQSHPSQSVQDLLTQLKRDEQKANDKLESMDTAENMDISRVTKPMEISRVTKDMDTSVDATGKRGIKRPASPSLPENRRGAPKDIEKGKQPPPNVFLANAKKQANRPKYSTIEDMQRKAGLSGKNNAPDVTGKDLVVETGTVAQLPTPPVPAAPPAPPSTLPAFPEFQNQEVPSVAEVQKQVDNTGKQQVEQVALQGALNIKNAADQNAKAIDRNRLAPDPVDAANEEKKVELLPPPTTSIIPEDNGASPEEKEAYRRKATMVYNLTQKIGVSVKSLYDIADEARKSKNIRDKIKSMVNRISRASAFLADAVNLPPTPERLRHLTDAHELLSRYGAIYNKTVNKELEKAEDPKMTFPKTREVLLEIDKVYHTLSNAIRKSLHDDYALPSDPLANMIPEAEAQEAKNAADDQKDAVMTEAQRTMQDVQAVQQLTAATTHATTPPAPPQAAAPMDSGYEDPLPPPSPRLARRKRNAPEPPTVTPPPAAQEPTLTRARKVVEKKPKKSKTVHAAVAAPVAESSAPRRSGRNVERVNYKGMGSGLMTEMPSSKKSLLQMLRIQMGLVDAGNDSPELLKRLSEILMFGVHQKWISPEIMRGILQHYF